MSVAENQINDLEYKEAQNNNTEQEKEKRIQKYEGSVSSLRDNFKYSNICTTVVSKGEKKNSKKLEIYLKKIMKEHFPNLVKEMDMQVQEAQRVPIMMDAKRPTPRHIIIKMPKVKDRESKSSKRKEVSYLQGSSHKTVR